MDAAADALVAGATRRRRRATPRPSSAGWRSAGPTSTSAPAQVAADLGLDGRPRPADDRAVRRPGGPGRPRRAAALAATTSTCSTSPPTTSTPTGSTCWRTFVDGLRRRGRGRQPRPRVPHPHGHAGRRDRPQPSSRSRVYGGGYDAYLDERSVARRHAREAYEDYAGTPRRARGARADAARLDGEGRQERPAQGHRQRQDRPQVPQRVHREAGREGPPDRAADRAAGRRRGAPQGVAAADGDRRRAALRRGRRDPAARRCAEATFILGPVDLQLDWRRPGRRHRAERRGQVDPARAAARPARRPTQGTRDARARACVVGEVDQARGLLRRRRPARSTPSRAQVPDWPTADVRTLLAKFGLGADHVCARRADACRPASGPGPRWRCCRPGREPARPRRADEPPRPAGDRAARGGPRLLRGHGAARHPRPSDAGDRTAHAALARRGRHGHRDRPGRGRGRRAGDVVTGCHPFATPRIADPSRGRNPYVQIGGGRLCRTERLRCRCIAPRSRSR